MPPKLYASMLLGTPQAVTNSVPKATKQKQPRALGGPPPPPAVSDSDEPTKIEKPKRVLSEETKAKLREARQRKADEKKQRQREEAEAARAAEQAAHDAEAAAAAKKAAAAEKRRLARQAKKEATNGHPPAKEATGGSEVTDAELDQALDEALASPNGETATAAAKPKKRKNGKEAAATSAKKAHTNGDADEHPPKWFSQFISKMMAEQEEQNGTKLSKKELASKAKAVAETKWSQPYTRERMQHAADSHMTDMYSMIFT
jgi:hypothetical protein